MIDNDPRSEVITGMTFARAMGLDSSVHSPKGQSRSLTRPVLLDYEPYDWRKRADEERARKGFAVDKVGRFQGRFHGTSWRGCAALVPTNLADNPTSYIEPVDTKSRVRGNVVKAAMLSGAPARGSLDSLRLGLHGIPKAKAAVGRKLGPGHYDEAGCKARMKSRGTIINDPGKASSAFRAPSRNDRKGDRLDVFAAANKKIKEEEEKAAAAAAKKATEDDGWGMYQNVRPVESLRFLRQIKKDDAFHELLKRIEEGKQTEEEREYLEKVKARSIRRAASAINFDEVTDSARE